MTDTTTAAAIAPKAYGAYALNKCLIGDGVINGVLNAGIFYLMHMADTGATFGLTDVLVDFAMTGLLLGIILAAIVIPLPARIAIRACSLCLEMAPAALARICRVTPWVLPSAWDWWGSW